MQQTQSRPREDWADDRFVATWLDRQNDRGAERARQFVVVRSFVPRYPDESFRYLNVGAGDGRLDEVLLERFTAAKATLIDGSHLMVERAMERLQRFGPRASAVRGDLASPAWTEALEPPFDLVVSTIAVHNLADPGRIRKLYAEIYDVVADGGFFMNFDYVRAPSLRVRELVNWASGDPEAGYLSRSTGGQASGSLDEQLGWLREAGFAPVDCFWKEFQATLFGGFKGKSPLPARG